MRAIKSTVQYKRVLFVEIIALMANESVRLDSQEATKAKFLRHIIPQ